MSKFNPHESLRLAEAAADWLEADAYARDAAQHHAEACRRLIRLRELLAKTLALAVDMDANYILEPPATTEILALLTWEEPNDG